MYHSNNNTYCNVGHPEEGKGSSFTVSEDLDIEEVSRRLLEEVVANDQLKKFDVTDEEVEKFSEYKKYQFGELTDEELPRAVAVAHNNAVDALKALIAGQPSWMVLISSNETETPWEEFISRCFGKRDYMVIGDTIFVQSKFRHFLNLFPNDINKLAQNPESAEDEYLKISGPQYIFKPAVRIIKNETPVTYWNAHHPEGKGGYFTVDNSEGKTDDDRDLVYRAMFEEIVDNDQLKEKEVTAEDVEKYSDLKPIEIWGFIPEDEQQRAYDVAYNNGIAALKALIAGEPAWMVTISDSDLGDESWEEFSSKPKYAESSKYIVRDDRILVKAEFRHFINFVKDQIKVVIDGEVFPIGNRVLNCAFARMK